MSFLNAKQPTLPTAAMGGTHAVKAHGRVVDTAQRVAVLQRALGNRAVSLLLRGQEEPERPSGFGPATLDDSAEALRAEAGAPAPAPRIDPDGRQLSTYPSAGPTRARLAMGAPGGVVEQEADRVAEQVVAAPAGASASSTRPRVQPVAGSLEEPHVVPASVGSVLASSGAPLEPSLRHDMERRFGHDFSQVRIHTGSAAERSAADVQARAYTVGWDAVFGANQFAPATPRGRLLIAHELTHVVQQGLGGAAPRLQRQPAPGSSRRGVTLSSREVSLDAHREHLRKQSGLTSAQVCTTLPSQGARPRGITTLEPGVPVTIVSEHAGSVWLQIRLPELPPGVGANDTLYIPAAFVKELTSTVREPPAPPNVNYRDFEISADPAHPGQMRVVSNPVDKRKSYIDARMSYMVFGLYLKGFLLYLDGQTTPVFVSNRFLAERKQSVSIGDRIYDSLEEANAGVAANTPAGSTTPRHAYYWGGGGTVIAPTVFSDATTPRIMATLYAAQAELARRVTGELGGIAVAMSLGRLLNVAYAKAKNAYTKDPPPKPPSAPPAAPVSKPGAANADPDVPAVPLAKDAKPAKPTTVDVEPYAPAVPAAKDTKASDRSTGRPKSGRKPEKEASENDVELVSSKKRDGGGSTKPPKASKDAESEDQRYREDERQDRNKGKSSSRGKARQQAEQSVAPPGSDPALAQSVDTAVKQGLNRTGKYADVDQWKLQSVDGPRPLTDPDPQLKPRRGSRYQATFRKPDGSTVYVSVNYDHIDDHFGTIKESSGKP